MLALPYGSCVKGAAHTTGKPADVVWGDHEEPRGTMLFSLSISISDKASLRSVGVASSSGDTGGGPSRLHRKRNRAADVRCLTCPGLASLHGSPTVPRAAAGRAPVGVKGWRENQCCRIRRLVGLVNGEANEAEFLLRGGTDSSVPVGPVRKFLGFRLFVLPRKNRHTLGVGTLCTRLNVDHKPTKKQTLW